MSEDIQKCCRICLDVESDHVPILGDPTIYLQIKSCLSMTVTANDNLPKIICTSCVAQLNEFYSFQLNARCSEDWLQSQLETAEEQARKSLENKVPVKPLPDSEYNSDSLLEFLNNTANIEEYLNNLGKEHIPSIVNILDRNQEDSISSNKGNGKLTNLVSCKSKEGSESKSCMSMEIDVLDSEKEIVKKLLKKEIEPKKAMPLACSGCKNKFEDAQKVQHSSTDIIASWTCRNCNMTFNSSEKMLQHAATHQRNTCNLLKCERGLKFSSFSKDCMYHCKQCNKTFRDKFKMYSHAKSHVLKDEERQCDLCGQKLSGNEALKKHKEDAHGSVADLVYRCKVCKFTSSDRKAVYLHVQEHVQGTEESKQLCECCGKSFSTKASLERHILKHEIKFKCKFCPETFCDAKLKDTHMLGHLDKNTMCEKCGHISNNNLERHICV